MNGFETHNTLDKLGGWWYSGLYENDHFNKAQAEFKKVLNGQSKHAAQKKGGRKKKKKAESQWAVWYTHSKRLTVLFQVGHSQTKGCIANVQGVQKIQEYAPL